MRRTDPKRRPYGRYIQEELCQPLNIPDLWIGIPDSVETRVATLYDAGISPPPAADTMLAKAAPANVRLVPDVYGRPDVRRACIAGTGGIFSARSEARFWPMLANRGELDGVRLLSAERVDAACLPREGGEEPDPVLYNAVMRLSQGGYWLSDGVMPDTCPAKGARTICSPGAGGSLGWADPDTGLAVAFCHNAMRVSRSCEEHPAYEIGNIIRESLITGAGKAAPMSTRLDLQSGN